MESKCHEEQDTVVLAALVLVVFLMAGVAVWIRLVAETAPELSGERASGNYDYSGFTGIDAAGLWEVEIERGDAATSRFAWAAAGSAVTCRTSVTSSTTARSASRPLGFVNVRRRD